MTLSESTRIAYQSELKRFEAFAEVDPSLATREQVEAYVDHLKTSETAKGFTRSPFTVNRSICILSNYYLQLLKDGIIDSSPALWLQKLKPHKATAKTLEDSEISSLQLSALLEEETGIRDMAIVMLLLHGLKAGELCNLNVINYYRDEDCLKVVGRRKAREVHLSYGAALALDQYLEWRNAEGHQTGFYDPLFISLSPRNYGGRLGYHGLYKRLKSICDRAGSSHASPEWLRQTFAVHLSQADARFIGSMEAMGYESAQSYRRFAIEQKNSAKCFELVEANRETRGIN